MNIKDPKNSVPEEQFGGMSENTNETENQINENKSGLNDPDESKGRKDPGGDSGEQESSVEGPLSDQSPAPPDTGNESEDSAEEEGSLTEPSMSSDEASPKEKKAQDTVSRSEETPAQEDEEESNAPERSEKTSEEIKKEQKEKEQEVINYSLLSKEDLVKLYEEILDRGNLGQYKDELEGIKSAFYKQHRQDIEEKKKTFLASGGIPEDFSPGIDDLEEKFKELLQKFKDLKIEENRLFEVEKEENLARKYRIIDEIKELVHRDESINKTFQEFRELQSKWHEIGIVPQKDLKELWENYHYHVEKFYDYIKINKELRDLDLKKNLESKIRLCEKAEALLLEPNVVNAFKILQTYHDQWREIGPVPKEKRSEIWERFREATSKINKKHQQFYQDLKENQKKNLESKTVLCEKAEEIASRELETHEGWIDSTNEILELQKVWKTIGFAPKKDNNQIYARFRKACDRFFNSKRDFYAQNMEEQQENLQKKLDLCIQAESLKDSTDWKKTTRDLINLQKQWKRIGPVPRKQSDEVWKRFRGACDQFFNRKSEYFTDIDKVYDDNLKLKEELINEIENFKASEILRDNLDKLNEFQRRWAEIGFVPFEKKDEITQKYREVIDKKFDKLQMDDLQKNKLKFRNKLENVLQKPRPGMKLRFEREKLMNKLQQLKNDIGIWENNIGFFAETKKAESMVKDFEKKIEDARDKIKLLEAKISMIDDVDPEEE